MINAREALIVPRPKADYSPSEGRFMPISSDAPEFLTQALTRTPTGPLSGVESGWRSGLLVVDGDLYKFKGARPTGEIHGTGPRGSQTLSLAEYEANKVMERREAFLKDGFDYPLEPLGLWVYDHILHHGEPNAATIYKAKGDTRLDELLWWAEKDLPLTYLPKKDQSYLRDIFSRIGLSTGLALRTLHNNNFTWDAGIGGASNAHDGNVVIFPNNGSVAIGIVDFDNSTTYYPESDEEQDPMEATQKHELKQIRDAIGENSVVSRANGVSYPYENYPKKLIDRAVRRALPDLSKEENIQVKYYLMNDIPRHSGSLRSIVAKSMKRGYEKEVKAPEISWEELRNLRQHIGILREGLVQGVHKKIRKFKDSAALIDTSRRNNFFSGYGNPVVINLKDITFPRVEPDRTPPADTQTEGKREAIDTSRRLVFMHRDHLAQFPQDGENFFSYPTVSDEILAQHRGLKKEDVGGIIKSFVNGDLEELHNDYAPRAIGSFLLALSQINHDDIPEALMSTPINPDDQKDMARHTRIEEIIELLPGSTKKLHGVYDYAWKIMGRRDEKEIKYRAGIELFAYGLVTHDLHEIFNHHIAEIMMHGLSDRHVEAITEAMKCPDKLDPWMGKKNVLFLLNLGLTGIQIRNGQRDNLALMNVMEPDKLSERVSIDMQYLLAPYPMNEVSDEALREMLEIPIDHAWVEARVVDMIRANGSLHPESFFARTLVGAQLDANELVRILQASIDLHGGDISKVDPTIMALLNEKLVDGTVEDNNAPGLVRSCIVYGIDIPDALDTTLRDEENQLYFMDFFPTGYYSHKLGEVYRRHDDYPVEPIYKFMTQGINALPPKIIQLYEKHGDKEGVVNKLGEDIMKSLFDEGFYKYYFGGAITDPKKYPKPDITLRDIYLLKFQYWRLVHSDIWSILNSIPSEIIAGYINENIEGRIRIEHNFDGKQPGWRRARISECLPPDLYRKIQPLIVGHEIREEQDE